MQEGDEMQEEQGEGQQSATATPSKSSAGTAATPRPEIHPSGKSTFSAT